MASVDEKVYIRSEEVACHGDLCAIRQNAVRLLTEDLNEAEDVVPAPAVQARGVIPQFVENFVHLEGAANGLDEHSGPNATARNAQVVLRKIEDVVPKPRFQIALHLRQIEVWTAAAGEQLSRIMEEVETKIEERGRDWRAVYVEVLLHQVPTSRAHKEDSRIVDQPVLFAVRIDKVDLTSHCVPEV